MTMLFSNFSVDPTGAGLHPHRPGTGLHRGRVSGGGVCRAALHQSGAEKVAV